MQVNMENFHIFRRKTPTIAWMRSVGWAALVWMVVSEASASAQTAAPLPLGGGATGSIRRTSNDLVDRLDIVWIEHGKVVFSYGNGKIFGIDIRQAMGNPAALRSTTQVKWDNFLAEFNSRVVILASRYPPQIYPDGAAVDPHVVFTGLGDTFNQMATEEQIDLMGYALRTTAMGAA